MMCSLTLRRYFLFIGCLLSLAGKSRAQDFVYSDNIGSAQLYPSGNQLGYPVLNLNSSDKLELHFDDFDADVKNYYYTFQLCNSDWTIAPVSQFDYLGGFSQVQITDYQFSSVALIHYTHYHAVLPDKNCYPTHSGNFLLKVYLDGDTSKMAFSRRFLVLDQKVNINAQVLQPLDNNLLRTHQRLQFNLNTTAINPSNPLEQIRVVMLQNNRWDNATKDVRPTLYVGNDLQYKSEDAFLYPGGAEWRWADLQSFRFQSDRIARVLAAKNSTDIFLKTDGDRSQGIYIRYKDYNGVYFLQTTESIKPLFQSDYAAVHFTFAPPGAVPFPDKDVYLFGSLTDYGSADSSRMRFNGTKGVYETSLFLKMGYYSYAYATVDRNDPARKFSMDFTEGSHMETENNYTILVYYRPLGGRSDQLVGMKTFSSITGRPGF
jgi:hypothetical protein